MDETSFQQTVEALVAKDPRYAAEAYYFLREALDHTVKSVGRAERAPGRMRHVTGAELCAGIRDYALQEFGPLAHLVLDTWGVRATDDIGELVYNLIAAGKLGATDQDKKSDFSGVYDFSDAFVKPYDVEEPPPPTKKRRR
ncbi:MAG: hypothetical protein FJ222_04735 [Lentisphaerae bacterium]|nr:hypothetical protein [Lentisphaerota bacterium]